MKVIAAMIVATILAFAFGTYAQEVTTTVIVTPVEPTAVVVPAQPTATALPTDVTAVVSEDHDVSQIKTGIVVVMIGLMTLMSVWFNGRVSKKV